MLFVASSFYLKLYKRKKKFEWVLLKVFKQLTILRSLFDVTEIILVAQKVVSVYRLASIFFYHPDKTKIFSINLTKSFKPQTI